MYVLGNLENITFAKLNKFNFWKSNCFRSWTLKVKNIDLFFCILYNTDID